MPALELSSQGGCGKIGSGHEQRKDNRHKEEVCIDADQFDAYVVADATTLDVVERSVACDGGAGASTVFKSTRPGFACDNPTDPNDLGTVSCAECDQCAANAAFAEFFPVDQSERAVMFAFHAPRSSFDVALTIPCDDCFLEELTGFDGGRNFLFGGMSSLCPWPSPAPTTTAPPSPPPPAPTASWDPCSGGVGRRGTPGSRRSS